MSSSSTTWSSRHPTRIRRLTYFVFRRASIARRDQTRVVMDGLTAANDLGFTTAVPARVSVLTDARLRPVHLGNQQIRFKTVAPSRLYWAGRPAVRIV
jgi:Family of unknown function (DUF6088)